VLEDPVLVGARAQVAAGTRLDRSVVGADVRIEAGAHLRDVVVLDGVTVAAGTEVARAVLGLDSARLDIEGTA
jgi:NDP-sugar pyrophosphorylase family protein